MIISISFSSVEYADKKKQTHRNRLLVPLERLMPWAGLDARIEPIYPKLVGRCWRPTGLSKSLADAETGKFAGLLKYTKACVRALVKHPFHAVKNLFKHKKARHRGLAENTAQLRTLFGFANLIRAQWYLNRRYTGIAS